MSHSNRRNLNPRSAGAKLLVAVLLASGGPAFAQAEFDGLPPAPPVPTVTAPSDQPASGPVDGQVQATAPRQIPRAAELWQDQPLSDLKASIGLNLSGADKLSPSEVARLNQAAPQMAANGSVFSPLGDSRPWMLAPYEWEAPATRHLPLLFEDPNLERLGYTFGCRTGWCVEDESVHAGKYMQPIISGAQFFGRVPLIPYLCGVDAPCEPVYTLGVDRPGSPVPYRRHFIPFSLRGALYEAGVAVGLAFAIP